MRRWISFFAAILLLLSTAGCTEPSAETVPQDTSISTAPITEATTSPETSPTITQPPTTEAPVTEPTPTEPAATDAPVTEPSTTVTGPPATVPTVTAPPVTQPPTTTPPVTEPQPTEPTVTEPPVTTPTETEPDLSGWVDVDGDRYYRDADGSFHVGWLGLDGDWYYFHTDGRMARGKVQISQTETRYFTASGKEVILVNPWNFVPNGYSPTIVTYDGWKMDASCKEPLKQMLADCEAAGYDAVVVSAYRTHEYQQGLFQRRIQRFLDEGYSQEEAETEAAKRVAFPGTSEHELGLALDIVDESYQNLNEKQETMPAQKWLMANSWRYGFILRYPNEKSEHTGIIYEPWHYRYVGKELAKELYDSGLCLEEYLDQLTETQ